MLWCGVIVVVLAKGEGTMMENWELALMDFDTSVVEVITQSELELIIEECDIVPIVFFDADMFWDVAEAHRKGN